VTAGWEAQADAHLAFKRAYLLGHRRRREIERARRFGSVFDYRYEAFQKSCVHAYRSFKDIKVHIFF
jgi:hypothetical protein